MITHADLGNTSFGRLRMLAEMIETGNIRLGGNGRMKIYGQLTCSSGKRLKMQHRVFFKDEKEALMHGSRPCGHCLREAYQRWKMAKEQG